MFGFSAATLWALLSICLVILEIMIPGIWFIWFTIPATITAIATYFWDLGLIAQLAIFIVLDIITLFLLFKFGRGNMYFNKEDEAKKLVEKAVDLWLSNLDKEPNVF